MLSALAVGEARPCRPSSRGSLPPADATPAEGTDEQPASPPLVSVGLLELLAYGLSRRTVGTVAVITAVGMELMARLVRREPTRRWAGPRARRRAARVLCIVGLVGRDIAVPPLEFTLRRAGERLRTREGLATIRSVEIPLRKVQIVQVVDLRRLRATAACLSRPPPSVLPTARSARPRAWCPWSPRSSCRASSARRHRYGRRPVEHAAASRASARALPGGRPAAVPPAMLCGIVAWVIDPIGLWAFSGLSLALPLAWLDWRWRRRGAPRAIVARRLLTRRTWVIARDKLQSVHLHQTMLMRWHRLGRVEVRVAGTESSPCRTSHQRGARDPRRAAAPDATAHLQARLNGETRIANPTRLRPVTPGN